MLADQPQGRFLRVSRHGSRIDDPGWRDARLPDGYAHLPPIAKDMDMGRDMIVGPDIGPVPVLLEDSGHRDNITQSDWVFQVRSGNQADWSPFGGDSTVRVTLTGPSSRKGLSPDGGWLRPPGGPDRRRGPWQHGAAILIVAHYCYISQYFKHQPINARLLTSQSTNMPTINQ